MLKKSCKYTYLFLFYEKNNKLAFVIKMKNDFPDVSTISSVKYIRIILVSGDLGTHPNSVTSLLCVSA